MQSQVNNHVSQDKGKNWETLLEKPQQDHLVMEHHNQQTSLRYLKPSQLLHIPLGEKTSLGMLKQFKKTDDIQDP